MKSLKWTYIIGAAIIIVSIIILIPAGTTWANSEFQSIPTMPPATNTPGVTPISSTNTPNPGTTPGNTAVPSTTPLSNISSATPLSNIPSATAAISGTLPVTLTPVSPTVPVSVIGVGTETLTNTPATSITPIGSTPVSGVLSSPTISTGPSGQSQNITDYAPVYYGLAAIVVLLVVFLWLRSRRKPGKS